MENDWHCPLRTCRKSVTNFGSSNEVIKTNPIYSAVSKSLYEIERIMSTATDNWWSSSCDTTAAGGKIDNNDDTTEEKKKMEHDGKSVENKQDDNEEEEEVEMEVVDFTHAVNNSSNHGTNSNNDNDNDESSISRCKEQHTTSFNDRTSFPSNEGPSSLDLVLPEFSPYCSPILPIRGSEVTVAIPSPTTTRTNNDNNEEGEEEEEDDKGGGMATASQLDRILHHPPNTSSSSLVVGMVTTTTITPKLSKEEEEEAGQHTHSPSHSSPRATTTTATAQSNQKKKKKKNGVTFQLQPKILPLIPTSKWNAEHSRQLRKWITDGRASLFTISSTADYSSSSSSSSLDNSNDVGGGIDDDGVYNFDDEGVAESFLSLLSSSSSSSTNNNDDAAAAAVPILSYYAISTEKDPNFSFDESVIVVPRSFMYYLVVACGLPIVDVDFLSMNQRGRRKSPMPMSTTTTTTTTGGQRCPFPKNDDPYLIQGATNHTWGAPIKARMAAIDRHAMWRDGVGPYATSDTLRPGTDLLCNYIVILIGDYDQPASSSLQQTRGKRKRGGKSSANNGTMNAGDKIGYRTRGNISILLRLCGAIVYDVTQIASSEQIQKGLNENQLSTIRNTTSLGGASTIHNDADGVVVPTLKDILDNSKRGVYNNSSNREPPTNNLLVMVKDESDIQTIGREFVNKIFMKTENNVDVVPIVSSMWLFNSIGEFQVQSVTMEK